VLRAVVFVDYQNMYRGARRAFGWESHPGHFGNFKPIGLARVLTQGADRNLEQVRVYTGVPTPEKDRRGNQITQRRLAAWVSDNPKCVEIFPRPLSYPPREGREKGVDVELAIDIVEMALDDKYDIAIIASADTDLVPALQMVHSRYPEKVVESVAWEPIAGCEAVTAAPIDIPGGGLTRRTVEKKHFDRFADRRNFTERQPQEPPGLVGRDRWERITKRLRR